MQDDNKKDSDLVEREVDDTIIDSHVNINKFILNPVISVIYGEDKGKLFPFNHSTIIGRGNQSDVIINDKLVSRSHLKVFYENNSFNIEDLNSANGTYLEGKKIDKLSALPGAVVKIGNTLITLTLKSDEQIQAEEKLYNSHKNTSDSIASAAIIQNTILSDESALKNYFSEYLIIWEPKDIVSGDIYLIEEITPEELLIFVIDCVGHGVSGAFITMSVKAIEQQILTDIKNTQDLISPAAILNKFNQHINQLSQKGSDNTSNDISFDGGVLYYNKSRQEVKYSGSSNTLIYTQDKLTNIIKGDKHSIGCHDPAEHFQYKEHYLNVNAGMSFYLFTDGYTDQVGGKKGFSFGRKNFVKLIEAMNELPMREQKKTFVETMKNYQGLSERRDDITLIGLKV